MNDLTKNRIVWNAEMESIINLKSIIILGFIMMSPAQIIHVFYLPIFKSKGVKINIY